MAAEKRIIFKRINRTSQREVKTIRDIEKVYKLNEAFWTTTGASVDAINCDPDFIGNLDFDGNKRIMCFEVKRAIEWLFKNLRDKSGIEKASFTLRLDAINTDHKEGRDIALSASQALKRLRKSDVRELSLAEVRTLKAEIKKTPLSGAGVVLPEAAEAQYIKSFLEDIIKTLGGVPHPRGSLGVTREKLDEFIGYCRAYVTWFKKGELPVDKKISPVKPLGEDTGKAFAALKKMRDKINEYFIQCRMAAYSEELGLFREITAPAEKQTPPARQVTHLSPVEEIKTFLETAPLARPTAKRVLVFDQPVNCYYEDAFAVLIRDVIHPLLGNRKKQITEQEWNRLRDTFLEFEKWQAEKQGEVVAGIGIPRLEQYLADNYTEEVGKLITASIENALILTEIKLLEKLILYQGLLIKFLNNFVYFPYLYDPARRALFEMGTLIMDGRKFHLSVKVYDHVKHMEQAKYSNMFILYVNVYSADAIMYEVAVPVTAGGKGNLYKGKRGIFHDIEGRDWDAMVIDIIENPISLSEALVTPLQKLTKLINSKIEELKNVAETKLDSVVKDTKITAQPAAQPQAAPKAGMGNLFMGGSIAIAALGSAMAFITKTVSEVKWYTLLGTIFMAFLAVLMPTFISAFNKLRKRDLSTILEASGWAVNVRMNLTFKLGKFFTQKPIQQKIVRKIRHFAWIIPVLFLAACIILFIIFKDDIFAYLSMVNPSVRE